MSTAKAQTQEASLHAIDYWQVLRNRYGIILLTLFLVFLTAAVITKILQPKYKSTAMVQLHGQTGGLVSSFSILEHRNFFETQFEVITAPETLKRVVDKMDLKTTWNQTEEQAVSTLRGMIETQISGNSDIIEITAVHIEAKTAKDIAENVALAYRDRRNEEEEQLAQNQLKALDQQIEEQEDRVVQKRKVVDQITQYTGVALYQGTGGATSESTAYRKSQITEANRFELAKRRDALKIRLASFENVDGEQLARIAAEVPVENNAVPSLHQEFLTARRALDTLRATGLGERHPSVLAQKKGLEGLQSDLSVAVSTLRDSMVRELQVAEKELANMSELSEKEDRELEEVAEDIHRLQRAEQEYQDSLGLLRDLRLRHSTERVAALAPREPIRIQGYPEVAKKPFSPNVPLYLVLGAVVGLVFGVAIAFFLEYADTSVKSLEDVEKFLQVPVLAVIPKDVGVLHKQSGMSPDAEAYRILRTNIEFNRKNPDDNAITVVSGGAGEGKSTTLVNLAYVCAQGGYTTIMIDADLRRPRLHTFFDINNSVGLTNYLTTDLLLEDVILQTPVDNLYFMPSGVLPADAAGILNSRRMSELVSDVKQRFDLVLVDSPPILGVSDASVLASEVDLTMIVVQHRKLPRNMLMRVKQAVENVGGHVIGVVLNNVDIRSDNQYQYYTSYYTYYAPSAEPEQPRQNKKAAKAAKAAAQAPAATNKDIDTDLY